MKLGISKIALLSCSIIPLCTSPATATRIRPNFSLLEFRFILMENNNDKADSGNTAAQENPNNRCNPSDDIDNPIAADVAGNRPRRTPFTDLNQVEADLALARTLQEQVFQFKLIFGSFSALW